jgi:hypothetical protein
MLTNVYSLIPELNLILLHRLLSHVDPLLGGDRVLSNCTTAVARQWLSSDHLGNPTDTNVIIAPKQRNGVFCAVRVVML